MKLSRLWFAVLFLLLCTQTLVHAQSKNKSYQFTYADTLRGSLSDLRTCYDVSCYDLNLRVTPETKAIYGHNRIIFKVVQDFKKLQLDLFENMNIDSIVWQKQQLRFKREGDAVFVSFPEKLAKGTSNEIKVYYFGQPKRAVNAPWDGGFVWKKDADELDWIGIACEGIGASLWFPCKDHLSDEPDSTFIRCDVPAELTCVANGKLLKTTRISDETSRYEWKVSYPINSYNITLNIGRYAHISDTMRTQQGKILPLNYYILRANADTARKHFAQVKPMLRCYEKYFGEYPFLNDGYKLVETPYWGMEHQSCIAYGNNFKNNKLGFDFIIIHESGHEYWGNSISCSDHAEMWIHESFCTYAEAIYVEELYGKTKALPYIAAWQPKVANKEPMLAPLGVNYTEWEGSDNYYKGALMLNTFRNVLANDSLWFAIIKRLNTKFLRKNVNTQDIIELFQEMYPKYAWQSIFHEYLKYKDLPTLEYKFEMDENAYWRIAYRWKVREKGFQMPVRVQWGKQSLLWQPTEEWQYHHLPFKPDSQDKLQILAHEFYVECKKVIK